MESLQPYSDDELLGLFKKGDEKAVAYIYRKHYKTLVYFGMEIIRDQAQAEDLAQDALLSVWENRGKLNSLPELKSYAYVSVKNAALNVLARETTRNKSKEILKRIETSEQEFIQTRMMLSELMVSVYNEINQLPPMYAEILRMLYMEELSPAEAAEKLQLTPENLRIRKFRALSLLRSELLKKGFSATALIYYYFLVTKG